MSDYNAATRKAVKDVYKKFAFSLIPIALTAVGGPMGALAGIGAIGNLVRFWINDRKPAVQAGPAEVAAMFHDVQQQLGWRLARV